jgi:TPR repeat protein
MKIKLIRSFIKKLSAIYHLKSNIPKIYLSVSQTFCITFLLFCMCQTVKSAESNIQAAEEASPKQKGRLPAEVRELLEAAKTGDPMSQFRLGIIYKEGNGVEKNKSEAIKWFKSAANNRDIMVKSLAVFQLKELGAISKTP